jgi:hypothetical protein
MLSSSVRHDVQQETRVVKAIAVKVDIWRTGHERIVFLCDKGNKKKKEEAPKLGIIQAQQQ